MRITKISLILIIVMISYGSCSALTSDKCPIRRGTKNPGYYFCDADPLDFVVGDIIYTVVLGLDNAYWESHQNFRGDKDWTDWSSMGGWLTGAPKIIKLDPYIVDGLVGSDHWCNQLDPSTKKFKGWYYCPR